MSNQAPNSEESAASVDSTSNAPVENIQTSRPQEAVSSSEAAASASVEGSPANAATIAATAEKPTSADPPSPETKEATASPSSGSSGSENPARPPVSGSPEKKTPGSGAPTGGKAPEGAAKKSRKRRPPNRSQRAAPRLPAGTITAVEGDVVRVDLGTQGTGELSIQEFDTPPQVGEKYHFTLTSIHEKVWRLSRKEARLQDAWDRLVVGRRIQAKVVGQNSGGLELDTGLISAFMPSSEVAPHRVADLSPLIGQTLECEVLEVVRRRKRVVLSRRAILAKAQREAREKILATLQEGNVVEGTVERLESFGAFVDLGGGVSGLLHVSNISHQRIQNPGSVLSVGQKIQVLILELKNRGKRIGLGMKQLQADPWDSVAHRFGTGNVLQGKVMRISDFGAFVEIEPAVEGLLHKSQLSEDRVDRVEDVLKVGEEVTVRVQSVDVNARRISLSRLSERGHVLGSDDDLNDEDLSAGSREVETPGTNLGDLLRKAMEEKEKRGS